MRRAGSALVALGLVAVRAAVGQPLGIRTYCNPLDIDYKYNSEQINERISYRSGADPVVVARVPVVAVAVLKRVAVSGAGHEPAGLVGHRVVRRVLNGPSGPSPT
jgi:hypothetical protein